MQSLWLKVPKKGPAMGLVAPNKGPATPTSHSSIRVLWASHVPDMG